MPKIVDHQAQRAAMLDGAFEVFADKGSAATSMRSLATGVGVSTGTLYHSFESKDDIFENMVRRVAERDVSAAVQAIPENADRLLRLQSVFGWIWANQTYLRRMLLLIFDFQRHRSDDEAAALVEQAAQLYRLAFEEQVGEHGPAWSMILGMLVQELLEPTVIDPFEHLTVLEALIIRTEANPEK
ncbi:MAG: TetR/AcrR family transcriptional regulator [Myxococcota bacterium]|nr:TetR/AcrR family transcriptional regulator [Myxococcota bacterium]